MTNDTSTLNGALTELGELMADNLVTMGVTDADASDGLTTLANKILDVPTGSCLTIELTSDKSILSYYDSETCTLSATVKENGVGKSGQTVEFFKGSTSLGTATTGSNGVATKSYSSTGSGDVSFTASVGSLSSESILIEDLYHYISGAKDVSSTFDIQNTGASYTLSIEDDSYKFVKQNDTQEKGIYAQLYEIPSTISSYQVEMVVKWETSNQSSFNNIFKMSDSITGQTNSLHCGTWSSSKILGYIKGNVNHRYNPTGRLAQQTWYKYTARYNHTTGEIYTSIYNLDSNTLVAENSQTDTFSTIPRNVILAILLASSTNYIKSIKVKTL